MDQSTIEKAGSTGLVVAGDGVAAGTHFTCALLVQTYKYRRSRKVRILTGLVFAGDGVAAGLTLPALLVQKYKY